MACPCKSCSCNKISDEELAFNISKILEKDPSTPISVIAKKFLIQEGKVVKFMPEHMRKELSIEEFSSIWSAISSWGRVKVFAKTAGALLEFYCSVPKGVVLGDTCHFSGDSALSGQLPLAKTKQIWMLRQPSNGSVIESVHFFTNSGGSCFGLYLNDANGYFDDNSQIGFQELWESLASLKAA